VVTEARAADKRRSIEGNDYLSYCWRTLRDCSCPIVVFGLSLRDQDAHLVDAINAHCDRPVAVSIRDHGERANLKEKHRIAHLIDPQPIYFFDSRTHPFGHVDLRIKEASWWKRIQTLKIGRTAA
jgi:hypothetical protein